MNSLVSRALFTAGAAGGAMLLAAGVAAAHVSVVAPGAAADSSGESGSGGVPLWPFIVAGVLVFGGGLWFALRKPRGEN